MFVPLKYQTLVMNTEIAEKLSPEERARLIEQATEARQLLSSRGINYGIVIRKRLGVSPSDVQMIDRIFNVAKGRLADRRITNELLEVVRLSNDILITPEEINTAA